MLATGGVAAEVVSIRLGAIRLLLRLPDRGIVYVAVRRVCLMLQNVRALRQVEGWRAAPGARAQKELHIVVRYLTRSLSRWMYKGV